MAYRILQNKRVFFLCVFVFCLLFLSNTLVLSNYGAVLTVLGVDGAAPLLGTAIELPGLDLEPYIYTPMYQIAVNNDFVRYNHTSLFGEDLRTFYALPILDWGLIFKPNLWAFFVVPPEYAYSLQCLISLGLFFIGFARLARTLGASWFVGVCLAAGIFFSGFVLYWWMLFGFLIALFPWVVMLVLKTHKRWYHFPLLYYLFCCWLIANFYPPLIIGLVFVAVVLALVLRPEWILTKEMIVVGIMAAFALCTAVIYLWDAIALIKGSVYPGDRVASGGQGYPAILWLGHVFPSLLQYDLRTLTSVSSAEQVGISSLFTLVVIFFADLRDFLGSSSKKERHSLAIILVSLVMMWAWMLLPLPSWVGSVLLWDHVQPRRLQAASGLMLFVLAAFILARCPLRFTLSRVVLFSIALAAPWYLIKFSSDVVAPDRLHTYLDLLIIPVVIIAYVYSRYRKDLFPVGLTLVSVVIVNILEFGRLQQLQSASSIFSAQESPAVEVLDSVAARNPGQILALNGFEGTILNGLGYQSVGHAFFLPTPEWYREHLPELNEEEYNFVFNRTSSVRLFHDIEPGTGGGVGVNLPLSRYGVDFDVRQVQVAMGAPDEALTTGGLHSVNMMDGDQIVIDGWAEWKGLLEAQSLTVLTEAKVARATMEYAMSRRGGYYIVSGFRLKLKFFSPEEVEGVRAGRISVCLVSDDPELGSYLIRSADDVLTCSR